LGNTPVPLFGYVHGDKHLVHTRYLLGMLLGFAVSCARQPVLSILPPAVYVRTRFTCRLASVDAADGEACSQKPISRYSELSLLYLHVWCRPARLLPLRWGSRAAYGRARRLPPPQVGVLGGERSSAPAAAPSGGGPGRCTAECAGCYPLSW
jgi:hypothetical protein